MTLLDYPQAPGARYGSVVDVPFDWCIAQTMSNQEHRLVQELQRLAIPHFLPCKKFITFPKGVRKITNRPLLAGYVFAAPPSIDAYIRINEMDRVCNVLTAPDQIQLLDELKKLEDAYPDNAPPTVDTRISPGVRCRVIAGAFRGCVGTIDKITGKGWAMLPITILGQLVPVEIETDHLEAM